MGNRKPVWATCGECGRSWNDAATGPRTPAPAGRCPFEDIHGDERMMYDGRPVKAVAIEVTVSVWSYVFADYADGEIERGTSHTVSVESRIGDEIADAVERRAHHLTDSEDGDVLIVPAGDASIMALKVHDIYDGRPALLKYANVTEVAVGMAGETF